MRIFDRRIPTTIADDRERSYGRVFLIAMLAIGVSIIGSIVVEQTVNALAR